MRDAAQSSDLCASMKTWICIPKTYENVNTVVYAAFHIRHKWVTKGPKAHWPVNSPQSMGLSFSESPWIKSNSSTCIHTYQHMRTHQTLSSHTIKILLSLSLFDSLSLMSLSLCCSLSLSLSFSLCHTQIYTAFKNLRYSLVGNMAY